MKTIIKKDYYSKQDYTDPELYTDIFETEHCGETDINYVKKELNERKDFNENLN